MSRERNINSAHLNIPLPANMCHIQHIIKTL